MGKLDDLLATLLEDEYTRYLAVCKDCQHDERLTCPVDYDITDRRCVNHVRARAFINDFKDFCAKYDII